MKLKHRLALYAIVIFSVIILIVSAVVYFSFYTQMEKKEMQSLENKTLLSALYYLEQDELPTFEHENVKSMLLKSISRKNIIIYDSINKKFNGEMRFDKNITNDFIEMVRTYNNHSFTDEHFFYNGIFYHDNQGDFVVITREPKDEFNEQMLSLLHILAIVSVIGLAFIYFFSLFLGHIAYEPILKIIAQIKERDTRNFNQPLELKKTYAEIDDLMETYNHFIHKISQTFTIQKNFIDYVSHELRTPITALLGTLEVAHNKKRTLEEHEQIINQLKQYTNDLQETLDQMMLLSGVKTSFEFKALRIDEIVWHVIENAVLYHNAQIDVDLQVTNEALLTLQGNEQMLELALNNLVGNAIKYSGNKLVNIRFYEKNNRLILAIIDQGIGIPASDLKQIKQNFYRGNNTGEFQGKGIGLSMADIILQMHNATLTLSTNHPVGTIVELAF
ncbi:HAMP domain-containing histidine kinase [Flavobacterium sp. CBA20B-1]|uniref:sensor histidine kinase n=1 Tax=unclassified Flavobacterium TaxID=196869 RepID=UPI0022254921|nr:MULTISPECIES: HAMP domain-containing sensor histidine kinase [unclassified Flavobacterium]WCM41289.1 HAMP domain-containing histidine kinase [Flavobacterium sp. CBA20B-1]